MEFQSLSISTKKKKTSKGSLAPKFEVKRLRNWTVAETSHLLDAIDEVQTNRGRVGFKFDSTEKKTIWKLFNEKVKNHPFEPKNMTNRITVLNLRFRICKDLAELSGGGWDEMNDRPIAPSNTDYKTMVESRGPQARFLISSSFPWYKRLLPMAGGQSARGEGMEEAHNYGDASVPLIEGPIQVSEQGSSDDPEEFSNDNNDSDAVEQPYSGGHRTNLRGRVGQQNSKGGSQCSRGARQSSESTFPSSQSSGSKRKTTDESAGETSSRGRRYKENAKKKQADAESIALGVTEIATCMRFDVDMHEKKEGQIMACLKKMQELGIVGAAQAFLIKDIEKSVAFRAMFLSWTSHHVADYLTRNNYFFVANQDQSTSNPDGYSPMYPNNVPPQSYPNHNQGGNNFSYLPHNSNF